MTKKPGVSSIVPSSFKNSAMRSRSWICALPSLRLLLGPDELHRCALAANAVARAYAGIVDELLARTAHHPGQVRAIGAHGQTVRHRPGAFDGTGYTTQLLNGALLAERCGIAVVCDLRSRDLAAGGQGAPLVPAFHAALFARADVATAVLNIGGIANLTLLGDQPRDPPPPLPSGTGCASSIMG
jgi:anhydro-N-acetylmuramic acid kinase